MEHDPPGHGGRTRIDRWPRASAGIVLAAVLGLLPGCATGAAGAPKPIAGTFVGKVRGSDALVAVIATAPERNARERVVQVYVCDGGRLIRWLPGRAPARANLFAVVARGRARADVKLAGAAARGDIILSGGRVLRFDAARATGVGGLYIVASLPDGRVRGQSDRGARLEGRVTRRLVGHAHGRPLYLAIVRIAVPGSGSRRLRTSWPPRPSESPGTILRVVVLPSGEMKGGFKHALRARPPGPPS